MYSFDSRVRYSEIGANGELTLESVLDYFQDVATFHSEDLGIGVEYLEQKNLMWVLSYWQIDVMRYPKLGERIRIGTFPYEFKGFVGNRNLFLEAENGEKLVAANSVWTLIHTENGRPERVLPEMKEKYVLEPKLPMEYESRKILLPADMEEKAPIEIQSYHLDTNQHVNNGQYLRIALQYVKPEFSVGRMRAEYRKSARQKDTIFPKVHRESGKYTISLENEQKEVYAIVELTDKIVYTNAG